MCAATAAMLDAAEPGSDRQLALARLHIESATEPQRLGSPRRPARGSSRDPRPAPRGRPALGSGDPVRGPGRGGRGADRRRARRRPDDPGGAVRRSGAGSDAQRAGQGGRLGSGRRGWAVQHGPGAPPSPDSPIPTPRPPCSTPTGSAMSSRSPDLFVTRSPGEGLPWLAACSRRSTRRPWQAADSLLAADDLPAGLRRVVRSVVTTSSWRWPARRCRARRGERRECIGDGAVLGR